MQHPIRRLEVVFAPHDHVESTATQRPTPSVVWYQTCIAIVDGRLDAVEASIEKDSDASVGGTKGGHDEGVGLGLAVGRGLGGLAGLKNMMRCLER